MSHKLNSLKSYILNVLAFVFSYCMPVVGFFILGYALKKDLPQTRIYASCGVLLAFLTQIVTKFV
ncbi:hypothetical protein DXD61_01265 [Eubacterium sp. TM06-47]|nr:hypothetical protein DXD61_01265 [Eubacterium sp. TM06-47]